MELPEVVHPEPPPARGVRPPANDIRERYHREVDDALALARILRDELEHSDGVELLERRLAALSRVLDEPAELPRPAVNEAVLPRPRRRLEGLRLRPDAEIGGLPERLAASDGEFATRASDEQQLELLFGLLQSELGYLFLDRTRIHEKSLKLSRLTRQGMWPGEEIVFEQKSYTKRTTTFEEQTEQEHQLDLELSSTLSTELERGLDRQRAVTNNKGMTRGGSLGGNIYGVQVGAQLSFTDSLNDADTTTSRSSVKDTSNATQKVASKYRTVHKTDVKVSTESGFEQSAKRTVRNPSRFRSAHAECFKVMQTLDLSQERYGVRLCWAPCAKDPAFDVAERIRLGREKMMKDAEAASPVGDRPSPPTKQAKPNQWVAVGPIEADKWGLWNDMSANYDLTIEAPAGSRWDGDRDSVRASLQVIVDNVDRGWHAYIVDQAWAEGANAKLKVHVGVDWKIGKRGTIYLNAGANFVADPSADDPEYAKAYKDYETAVARWEAGKANLAAAKADAAAVADQWEARAWAELNPFSELMSRIITHFFPPALRDECWEIDYWQQLFDWEAASYRLYPAWWSSSTLRNWTKDPSDFVNASWAKLYVPVKVGMEREALRWIVGKTVVQQADDAAEQEFDRLARELRDYRREHFGHASETKITQPRREGACPELKEKYICLAHWEDDMPTDGVHVEVVLGATSAMDPDTEIEVKAANELREAEIKARKAETKLIEKTTGALGQPNVDIRIHTNGAAPGSVSR